MDSSGREEGRRASEGCDFLTVPIPSGAPGASAPREQVRHMWKQWLRWATTNQEKRRALAQLEAADDVTAESHQIVRQAQRGMAERLERSRADGPMQDVPLAFVVSLIGAIADATMDAMIREPSEADACSDVAFEAAWRVLAGSPAEQRGGHAAAPLQDCAGLGRRVRDEPPRPVCIH